jgi:RND family efflux transporter MFP subunit
MAMKWRLLLAAAVLAIVGLIVWAALRPVEVEVAQVVRGDLIASLAATGTVESRQADVSSEAVGRLLQVEVDEGDPVAEGQLLARLEAAQEQAAVSRQRAALAASEADAARAAAALAAERKASAARIAGAGADLSASRARLKDLEAGSRPQEIAAARQAVAAAEAEASLAEKDDRRIRDLFDKGAVSASDRDQARTRLESAQAALGQAHEQLALLEAGSRPEQIAAARAQVASSESALQSAQAAAGLIAVLERSVASAEAAVEQAQAGVAAAESDLSHTDIRAPAAGQVVRRYVDVGDLASPGTPLFLLRDNTGLWVVAEVDEEDVDLVYKGQKVEVSAEALARPIEGTVVEVGQAAFPRGLQQVRAKIVRSRIDLEPGPGVDLLRPGMEVDVNGSRRLAENALLLPLDALVESGGESFTWVVQQGRLHRRKIEIGRQSYRQAQVLSGLQEGDSVVISGSRDLSEGRRVKARGG